MVSPRPALIRHRGEAAPGCARQLLPCFDALARPAPVAGCMRAARCGVPGSDCLGAPGRGAGVMTTLCQVSGLTHSSCRTGGAGWGGYLQDLQQRAAAVAAAPCPAGERIPLRSPSLSAAPHRGTRLNPRAATAGHGPHRAMSLSLAPSSLWLTAYQLCSVSLSDSVRRPAWRLPLQGRKDARGVRRGPKSDLLLRFEVTFDRTP